MSGENATAAPEPRVGINSMIHTGSSHRFRRQYYDQQGAINQAEKAYKHDDRDCARHLHVCEPH